MDDSNIIIINNYKKKKKNDGHDDDDDNDDDRSSCHLRRRRRRCRACPFYLPRRMTDRRMAYILVLIGILFSVSSMKQLVHLQHQQEQPLDYSFGASSVVVVVEQQHVLDGAGTGTGDAASSRGGQEDEGRLLVQPSSLRRKQQQQQNQGPTEQQLHQQQGKLGDESIGAINHHHAAGEQNALDDNNNVIDHDDVDHDDDDPIEHYRDIFCPRNKHRRDDNEEAPPRAPRPILLWGIPSTASTSERTRRQLIRSTYLNYYRLLDDLVAVNNNNNHKNRTSSTIKITTTTTTTIGNHNHIKRTNRTYNNTNLTAHSRHYDHRHRICSLHQWTCQHSVMSRHCQIIYVFFVGAGGAAADATDATDASGSSQNNGNSGTVPPLLVDESLTDFRSMLYTGTRVRVPPPPPPPPPLAVDENTTDTTTTSTKSPSPLSSQPTWIQIDKHEPGVVYLNIRENQFDGKMTTWFQFAALVGKEYPTIDYAAKVDSDLLLFTPNFMAWIEHEHIAAKRRVQQGSASRTSRNDNNNNTIDLTTPTRRIYGGIEFPDTNCDVNTTHDHACPLPLVGRSYMSGELNFMSMDLAQYIASDDCPRDTLTIPHEDVSLSNYVYSYENNTRYHQRKEENTNTGNNKTINDNNNNHTIEVISVSDRNIMLTRSMAADWTQVSLTKSSERFLNLLWGHSIRRGKHKQYLVYKTDKTFESVWSVFLRRYLDLMGLVLPTSSSLLPGTAALEPPKLGVGGAATVGKTKKKESHAELLQRWKRDHPQEEIRPLDTKSVMIKVKQ